MNEGYGGQERHTEQRNGLDMLVNQAAEALRREAKDANEFQLISSYIDSLKKKIAEIIPAFESGSTEENAIKSSLKSYVSAYPEQTVEATIKDIQEYLQVFKK